MTRADRYNVRRAKDTFRKLIEAVEDFKKEKIDLDSLMAGIETEAAQGFKYLKQVQVGINHSIEFTGPFVKIVHTDERSITVKKSDIDSISQALSNGDESLFNQHYKEQNRRLPKT